MHARMLLAFRLIEAIAAGKNQIGPCQQIPLQYRERRIGAAESRQLVHAVIHNCGAG